MTPQVTKRIDQIRRGEVPEGYKRTKVGIVPKEWEEGFLGNYIQEYKELSNDIEKYPVYSSSRQGLIPQSQYYDNRKAVETNLGYKIVPNGYVTYRHMSDDDVFHFNVNNTGGEILVSSEYPVFSSTEKSSLGYIIPMLNDTARFRYFCRTQKMGGTRTRLYYKNLCNYKSVYPSLAEQEKIAEILTTQDKLIELQRKKIDELKKLKKVYLSKMFPKKGCNVPEIRFPEFTDPWEQRKLGDVVETVTDYVAAGSFADLRENVVYKDSPDYAQLVRTVDLKSGFSSSSQVYVDRHAFDFLYRVNLDEESIIIPNIGNCGEVYYIRPEELPYAHNVLGPNAIMVRSNSSDNQFLSILFQGSDFQEKLKLIISPNGQTKFNKTELKLIQLILPNDKAEQKKIGELFGQLDNLITLHQRKLEEEQKKKKALMQFLLTGIVRTNK